MNKKEEEEDKKSEMITLWEKLGDSEKKVLMMRELEGKIMKKEHMIKQLQYKVETMKTIKLSQKKDAHFFEAVYQAEPPRDIGRPQKEIIQLEQAGEIVGSVLDVGCGTGENALYLAGQGHEVWGIDFTPIAIHKAEEKATRRNLHVTFLILNALELHALGREFDTIIDSGLFHVLSDEERPIFVDNLAAVIHRGGTYFMLCFSELTALPDFDLKALPDFSKLKDSLSDPDKLKDLLPYFDKLKERGYAGPRRVTQAEIRASFQDGWRINYIRQATMEGGLEQGEVYGWLSSISKE